MYEASFGLKRRPFAATPDATCFLSAAPIQAALDEIVVCVEQGQGIAVLTAPAGIGKTLICERLCSELSDRFQIAFLRHSSFLTRRALLQTLLCELNHPYQHPSEQELRLELLPAIRELRPEREAFVIICDEAHHLTEHLIEELRILADYAESGRPLVRLVLVGQLPLEEKLAQPSLEAFNQRIRAHVNLPTFDRAGSLDYIDYRLTWGGGRTEELFTPAALNLIARASDGVPRCLNQLADHSLLLAYVADQRPVGEEIVLEALNDLRQLPLHWNEFSRSSITANEDYDESSPTIESTISGHDSLSQDATSQNARYSYESEVDETNTHSSSLEANSFQIGAEVVQSANTAPIPAEHLGFDDEIQIDVGSDDWKQTVNLFAISRIDEELESTSNQPDTLMSDVQFVNELQSELMPVEHRVDRPHTFHETDSIRLHEQFGQSSATEEYDQRKSTVESPVVSYAAVGGQSENSDRNSRSVDNTQFAVTETTSSFQEEVVIDRYASIDAGLTPVAVSVPDKTKVSEVRAVSESVENSRPTPLSDHPRVHEEDFSDLDAESDHVPQYEPDVPVAVKETVDHVLGAVRELIDLVSEHKSQHGSDMIDSAYSIARPAGISNPDFHADEESILKTLRREMEDQDVTSEMNRLNDRLNSANGLAWEAVETESVEQTTKPRPFRYLFSMLRRKQQEAN